jgi:hypothetical protein
MDDEAAPNPPAEDEFAPPPDAGEAADDEDSNSRAEPEAPPARTEAHLPAPEPTGLPQVDGAVDQLGSLADLPVHDHVEVFDDVQRRLHDALAELDDEQ